MFYLHDVWGNVTIVCFIAIKYYLFYLLYCIYVIREEAEQYSLHFLVSIGIVFAIIYILRALFYDVWGKVTIVCFIVIKYYLFYLLYFI